MYLVNIGVKQEARSRTGKTNTIGHTWGCSWVSFQAFEAVRAWGLPLGRQVSTFGDAASWLLLQAPVYSFGFYGSIATVASVSVYCIWKQLVKYRCLLSYIYQLPCYFGE